MRHVDHTRWLLSVGTAIGLYLCLSVADAGATEANPPAIGPVVFDAMTPAIVPIGTEKMKGPIPSASLPSEAGLHVRTIPTLSKQLSVGGTTLEPYIGAGFGGGYATDLDRSLNAAPISSGSIDSGLKSLFGQSLIPNEVQLGVRLSF
jgi:hypothetical protein